MKRKIIIILITVIVFVSVSYIFDRCSHAIVDDLYEDIQYETTTEVVLEKDTDDLSGFSPKEREVIIEGRRLYPIYEKYIEKYGMEQYRKYVDDPKPVMYEMCKKNGDWSIYPISDRTYEKYNEKDGLLGDIEYDNIELVNWIPVNEYISSADTIHAYDPAEVLVTQGKKKTKYYIKYIYGTLLENIEVYTYYDSFITDENGNELEVGGPVTDLDILKLVVDKYDTKVGLSKKFKEATPDFNGLVNVEKEVWEYDINETGYRVEVCESESNFNDGIGIFKVKPLKRGASHKYRVDFKLDEKGFLDEAKVTLLK